MLYCDYFIFLEQVKFFEDVELTSVFQGVKGSLANHIDFWEKIGASDFFISTIKDGYIIPFLETAKRIHCSNNKSAFNYSSFVSDAIEELLNSGCVKQVPFVPNVVNPLSVAADQSGNLRLILDLNILNTHVRKDTFKFEDWKIAV